MAEMTHMQRVINALSHKEADRLPFFITLTLHGAKELDMPLKEYFYNPVSVAEGQLCLQKKYDNDALYGFYYAAIETEAFGGDIIFTEDAPPVAGNPIIKTPDDIKNLKAPDVKESKRLNDVLETIRLMKKEAADDIPIFSVVLGPFSLPVIQMGFDKYLDMIYEDKTSFERLMDTNIEFCINLANAQLEAGATAVVYFDPVSSLTITPRDLYLRTGYVATKKVLEGIKGPVVCHLASGRGLDRLDKIIELGFACATAGIEEDIKLVKEKCKNKITVVGGINALEMRNWSPEETEKNVKQVIAKAASGGGFILSDYHGEIPYQVPDDIIKAYSDAVHKWGRYPLDWIYE